jgi:hypothetical protein
MLRQLPVERGFANAEGCRDLTGRFFGGQQLDRLQDLLPGEFRLAAKFHTSRPGCLHSGPCPFADKAPFQLGQDGDHLPHSTARWRGRVDMLREGKEFNPPLPQLVEHSDQIANAPAQAVELPDHKRVAGFQCPETAEQGRALRRRSRKSVICKNLCAPGPLQCVALQSGVLVVCRYAGVAVFHALILRQTFETHKPLISAGQGSVAKLTLCETAATNLPTRFLTAVASSLHDVFYRD